MHNFGLIGAAGYIAPRHMKAISETGNNLTSALDLNDSVGIIDSYFPDAVFFTEFEQFACHIEKLRRDEPAAATDYISICSPNYLHDYHIRFALRTGANAICEKPLVFRPADVSDLMEVERETGHKVSTILQLRFHPAIIALRNKVQRERRPGKYDVDLSYITSRGHWYLQSWKGNERKSGGIVTDIGIHFYDMLYYVFGELQENIVHYSSATRASGYLEFANARVRWFLSVEINDVPEPIRRTGQRTYRSITVNGDEIEFSGGFTDLHTRNYEAILAGEGFSLKDNLPAIYAVDTIRNQTPIGLKGEFHPLMMPQVRAVAGNHAVR